MQETIINESDDLGKPLTEPLAVNAIPPTPNDPPWNWGVALGVWFASIAFIIIVPGLVLLPYILNLRSSLADTTNLGEFLRTDKTAILLQMASTIPAHILTLVLAWIVVTRMRRYSFREMLGWHWGGMTWWHYGAVLAGFFVLAAVVGSYFPEQENDLIRILQSSRAAVYLVAFMAIFTAPVVEEVVYRGILYSALQRTFGVTFGVVAVTFFFALVHVPQYYPSFSTIFLLTVLSLVLTLVRVRTNNLLPCIILHTLFNAVQAAGLIFGPYFSGDASADVPAAVTHLFK